MKASKFKSIMQELLFDGTDLTSPSSKLLLTNSLNYMMELIGDHVIPLTYLEYGKLLDSRLGANCDMGEANAQMKIAAYILILIL